MAEKPEGKFGMPTIETKEFGRFTVEALSVGKKKDQSLNEDRLVATENTLAVIDGATPRVPFSFGGKSGAQFAADLIKDTLVNSDPSINGAELVDLITKRLSGAFDELGVREELDRTPEARPAAIFAVARFVGNQVIITQVGDVGVRINREQVLLDKLKVDAVTAQVRIEAMERAKAQKPSIRDEELLTVGKDAIDQRLKDQAIRYYNNAEEELGHGIINGLEVPANFIKVTELDVGDVDTFEIFSDGYFKIPVDAAITAWEKALDEVEARDPLKVNTYPSVKGSTADQYTDDRSVLIATLRH